MAKTRRRIYPTRALIPTIVAAIRSRPSSGREINLFAQLNGYPSAGQDRLDSICRRIAARDGLVTSAGSLGETVFHFLPGHTDLPVEAVRPIIDEDERHEERIRNARKENVRRALQAKQQAAGTPTDASEVADLRNEVARLAAIVTKLEGLAERLDESTPRRPAFLNGRLPLNG